MEGLRPWHVVVALVFVLVVAPATAFVAVTSMDDGEARYGFPVERRQTGWPQQVTWDVAPVAHPANATVWKLGNDRAGPGAAWQRAGALGMEDRRPGMDLDDDSLTWLVSGAVDGWDADTAVDAATSTWSFRADVPFDLNTSVDHADAVHRARTLLEERGFVPDHASLALDQGWVTHNGGSVGCSAPPNATANASAPACVGRSWVSEVNVFFNRTVEDREAWPAGGATVRFGPDDRLTGVSIRLPPLEAVGEERILTLDEVRERIEARDTDLHVEAPWPCEEAVFDDAALRTFVPHASWGANRAYPVWQVTGTCAGGSMNATGSGTITVVAPGIEDAYG